MLDKEKKLLGMRAVLDILDGETSYITKKCLLKKLLRAYSHAILRYVR